MVVVVDDVQAVVTGPTGKMWRMRNCQAVTAELANVGAEVTDVGTEVKRRRSLGKHGVDMTLYVALRDGHLHLQSKSRTIAASSLTLRILLLNLLPGYTYARMHCTLASNALVRCPTYTPLARPFNWTSHVYA